MSEWNDTVSETSVPHSLVQMTNDKEQMTSNKPIIKRGIGIISRSIAFRRRRNKS